MRKIDMQFRFFLADFFFFNSVFCERSEVSLCVSGMARTQQEMISVCWQSLQALLAESVHLLCMLRGPWGPQLSVSSLVWVLLDFQVAEKEVASRGLSGSSRLHCCQSFGHFIDLSQGCSF